MKQEQSWLPCFIELDPADQSEIYANLLEVAGLVTAVI